MLKRIFFIFPIATMVLAFAYAYSWTPQQLMKPSELAAALNSKDVNNKPVVLNIGSMKSIRTAIQVGPVASAEGLENLKQKVKNISRDRLVVVYCGCCKLGNCPNVKPAYDTLLGLGFTKVKVLELPEGFNEDWASKGYPVE